MPGRCVASRGLSESTERQRLGLSARRKYTHEVRIALPHNPFQVPDGRYESAGAGPMTTKERIGWAAEKTGWSVMVRPYACTYHRGGLIVAVDYGPTDDALAGWWSYTAPGLGQLAAAAAVEPIAATVLAWLADASGLIDIALSTVAAAEETAARLIATRAVLEAFSDHHTDAVIDVAAFGRAMLHVIAPEDYPDVAPMPLPRLEHTRIGGAW